MTTTTIQPPVTGQDINVAARAVRTLLDVLLAESGASTNRPSAHCCASLNPAAWCARRGRAAISRSRWS